MQSKSARNASATKLLPEPLGPVTNAIFIRPSLTKGSEARDARSKRRHPGATNRFGVSVYATGW
jgi:hypothetical protein